VRLLSPFPLALEYSSARTVAEAEEEVGTPSQESLNRRIPSHRIVPYQDEHKEGGEAAAAAEGASGTESESGAELGAESGVGIGSRCSMHWVSRSLRNATAARCSHRRYSDAPSCSNSFPPQNFKARGTLVTLDHCGNYRKRRNINLTC
jgi:hypothetical protein